MTGSIDQRVRQVAADVFNLSPDEITPQSSPQSIETWDSVQHLNLVLALEEEFAVQIAPEEIEQMRSIGEIIELMRAKVSE